MGDWSELLPELLVMIARRIQLVEDFVALRGVCTSWRAAASKDNFVQSWPTVPLLMLTGREGKDSDDREFYSLSRGKIWRKLSLPEAKGRRCIESRGWLLTEGMSGELGLLNPFSRVQIELPHAATFPDYEEIYVNHPYFIFRAVLSANPSDTSDFVFMVIYGCYRILGFWRPGHNSWTRIETLMHDGTAECGLSDVISHNGKVYAINFVGYIWVWDISRPDNPTVAQLLVCLDSQLFGVRESYLVESSGALLVVAPYGSNFRVVGDTEIYGFLEFTVFQLDLIKVGWEEITSLGRRAIFLGDNGAFSVDATSFQGVIKPDCVYFTENTILPYTHIQGGGEDMGVYHLQDGKIEPFLDLHSFGLICSPLWVTPSL